MSDHGIGYRDYQVEARDAAFDEFEGGTDSTLVVMPTGTGKTVLAGMCVEKALEQGMKTLFVAHREVLIEQAYNTFSKFGFDVAIEMGQQNALTYAAALGQPDVVVGSVQTLQDDRLMRWANDTFGLIIIDECHRSLSDSYTKLLNWFGGYKLLGITATPKRGDERNLGTRFATKAYEYTLRNAIQKEWLAPIRTRECPVTIDLRGIKLSGGDYAVGDLEERIGPRIEQLCRALIREVADRPTVIFTPDVGSAMATAQVLADLGKSARYVAGTGGHFGMTKAERKLNLAAYNAGEYQFIVCCELLIEGWDCPRVEAVVIMRPTQQQYRYMQMVGRGTRPSPETGKLNCLVVDFDWETDKESKDLCSIISLFDDGSLNEEVFATAREIAAERAVDIDPMEVLEEAEKIVRTRTKFAIRLTGQEAQYAALEYDPVGVAQILDFKLNRRYDLDKKGENPASDKQLGLLKHLGITAPESLSKWGASKMIDKLMKRQRDGFADAKDVHKLLSAGVRSDLARVMTATEATGAIQELAAIRPTTQGRLFQ